MLEEFKDMSNKKNDQTHPQNAKVLQLGFNISVSGDPGTDFQIVLDDKEKVAGQTLLQNEIEQSEVPQLLDSKTETPKDEIENIQEVKPIETTGAIPKHKKQTKSESASMSDNEKSSSTSSKDFSIINEIKSTMQHFEKFSDHIKEIPRLKNRPVASSTPFADKLNSKSESNLIYSEYKPRRYTHLYDFNPRREYFRGSVKPLPPDLFLKPLPGENFYRRGMVSRYFDLEPSKHYGSVDSLSKTQKSKYDFESEAPMTGILKKSDSESGDKFSTSSAESVKDIKIYQSGGILIMQNFKDSMDASERKEISDFSAKLIENCNKLKEEVNAGFPNIEENVVIMPVEESKSSGKMVQFDLTTTENLKSKSSESSYNPPKDDSFSSRMESSESVSDCVKNKEPSPQGTPQSQDLTSLSTQENDSIVSNQPGMSPTSGAAKKLEWDSGADVGYLNLDLSKENLSTIERIVLKGLSSDGVSEKKVIYEKKPEQPSTNRSKFILERMPSELVIEEIVEDKRETGGGDEKKKGVEKVETDEVPHVRDEVREKPPQQPKTARSPPPEASRKSQEFPKPLDDDKKPKRKTVDLTDKSVNVNTLFKDSDTQITKSEEALRLIDNPKFRSSRLSPRIKRLRKKRLISQKSNLTAPLKEKIDTIIDIARYSARSSEEPFDMGIPKRVYRKVEANPDVNELELSREVEEIVIDQRFKIKQAVGKGNAALTDGDGKKETKTKNRPVSASSSSNNTVLPNIEVKEGEKKKKEEENKFTDQIVQTNESKTESVAIQAFASQQSSDYNFRVNAKEKQNVGKTDNVNTSSKNIQAFGLNSSLPKELAHPKETNLPENQNTKSTQFFGGPINSLPNYHSNLITKPVESCSRMPKVLKTRKNLEAEIIRLREENQKNIMANDVIPVKDTNNIENKENLITDSTSKKSLTKTSNSNVSSLESNKRDSKSRQTTEKENPSTGSYQRPETGEMEREVSSVESSRMAEKEKPSVGSCQISEVSSQVLTSEVLREHGGSIDKNIIKEKYFQSQLLELEKRAMISKSTSMEKVNEYEAITVGCQYSPQPKQSRRGSSSKSQTQESSLKETKKRGKGRKASSERRASSHDVGEVDGRRSRSQDQDFGGGDSLPSSTQTAHSWIPGMQDSERNNKSVVGRARSFEYLPGHIYESSGNLREELPSETERNLISCTSSGSSNTEMAKGSISEGLKNSEGRSTLVLENSTDNSVDFGPMKILDENLTQLNLVVSKLWEKDAKVQSITQSLLVNLWQKNGSGDCSQNLGASDSPKTDIYDNLDASNGADCRKESGDGYSESRTKTPKKKRQGTEISTACQTEDKLPSPDVTSEKILEEKTVLEKRISREKENQIKWIENEIHHLNLLRGLLEKQNSSLRRKKHSPLSLTMSSDENLQKSLLSEVPQINNSSPEPEIVKSSCVQGENFVENLSGIPMSDGVKYGMAVSFTEGVNHLRKIVMLPVGVQVSSKEKTNMPDESEEEEVVINHQSPRGGSFENRIESRRPSTSRNTHFDVNTQYPSRPRSVERLASASAQTSFLSRCTCRKEACLCRENSDKSCESGNTNKSKSSDRRDSLRLSFACEEEGRDNPDCNPIVSRKNSANTSRPDSGTNQSLERPSSRQKTDVHQASERANYQCVERTSATNSFKKPCQVVSYCREPLNDQEVVKSHKPGVTCQNHYESNIYLKYETPYEDVEPNHHSHVQPQKATTCACPVIKIHGPACCSPEANASGKPCPAKVYEHQSCQTEEAKERPPRDGEEEKHDHSDRHNVKRFESPGPENKPKHRICCCEKKQARKGCICQVKCHKRQKDDDHPRQYFLKIEEKESDDCNDTPEPKKGVEVITVTVPVKRAEKSRKPCRNQQEGSYRNQQEGPYRNQQEGPYRNQQEGPYRNQQEGPYRNQSNPELVNTFSHSDCKCCEECLVRLCEKITQQFENQTKGHYRRCVAEKPQSPKVNSHQSFENEPFQNDNNFMNAKDCYYDASNTLPSYSQESCQNETSAGNLRSDPYNYENYELAKCIENCICCTTASNTPYSEESYPKNYASDKAYPPREQMAPGKYSDPSYDHPRSPSANAERKRYENDYYNYNKQEYMTKSELIREKEKKKKTQPSLQECLANNRPDFYYNAESRRRALNERAKERSERYNNRVECLMNLMHYCNEKHPPKYDRTGSNRLFTTSEMKQLTMKKYRNLPEVTGKIADEKKKQQYKTNKIMAEIFAKKLQRHALKGRINLSNSFSVLSTI